MSCDPVLPVEEPQNPVEIPSAPGGTRLVADTEETQVLTSRRDTDALTALCRGLREYLEQISVDVAGARVQFASVLDSWAEPNVEAAYPSAVVQVAGEATYDAVAFTPAIDPRDRAVDGQYLVRYSEVATLISIEAHCASPGERVAVSMLLEDALNPVDWMYGFKLALPHYFGQFAVYEPVRGDFQDDALKARHNLRPFVVTLEARVPVRRVRRLPDFQPKLSVEVLESGT